MSKFDVIIIGGGPAGLFAADTLKKSKLKVLLIDKGDKVLKRTSKVCGIGGAGTFSDGKLNLSSKIGCEPEVFGCDEKKLDTYIDKVDRKFTELGVKEEYYGTGTSELNALKRKAHSFGIDFIAAKQRHIGTDNLPLIINKFYRQLSRKIKFLVNCEVKSVNTNINTSIKKGFEIKTTKGPYESKYLIIAPGRAGSYWFREQASRLGIQYSFGPIDVGIRVEFPYTIYDHIEKTMYDAKFKLRTDTHDDLVRTFCTNPKGFVCTEGYDGFVLVNGFAATKAKSENTNFALLSRVELTDPIEDTTSYGRDIARISNTLGGGKPIIQRLKDLKKGRRSYWHRINNSSIRPTLRNATPGDIAMALPDRIITNLREAICRLDNLMPGLESDNTLLYAPEIKFYDTKFKMNKNMESTIPNLFIAGDASGHTRGIVFSAVTGIIAAESILSRC